MADTNFVRTVTIDCSGQVPYVLGDQVQQVAKSAMGVSGTYARGPQAVYILSTGTSVVAGPVQDDPHSLHLQTFDTGGNLLAEVDILTGTPSDMRDADLYGLYAKPGDPTEVSAMVCYQPAGAAAPTVAQVIVKGIGSPTLTMSQSTATITSVGQDGQVWLYGATSPYVASPGLVYGYYDDQVFPPPPVGSVQTQAYGQSTLDALTDDPVHPEGSVGTPMGAARYVFEVTGLPWAITGDNHAASLQVVDYSSAAAPVVVQMPLPSDLAVSQDPVDASGTLLAYFQEQQVGYSSQTAARPGVGLILHARNAVQNTKYQGNQRYSTVLWAVNAPTDGEIA